MEHRANPSVGLRIRGGSFAGLARELEDPHELERAGEAYCESVYPFDYIECSFHLGGRPTAERIKAMLRDWFGSGFRSRSI